MRVVGGATVKSTCAHGATLDVDGGHELVVVVDALPELVVAAIGALGARARGARSRAAPRRRRPSCVQWLARVGAPRDRRRSRRPRVRRRLGRVRRRRRSVRIVRPFDVVEHQERSERDPRPVFRVDRQVALFVEVRDARHVRRALDGHQLPRGRVVRVEHSRVRPDESLRTRSPA